jgi:hypothetical protein
MKVQGGVEVAPPFSTSTLDDDEWSAAPPGKQPLDTYCIGG